MGADALPDDLERAWVWLEGHGYGIETPGGYYVTVSSGEDSDILFTASTTLEGWLEPGASGHADLLPIGEADGSGSITALWRDGDAVRAVLLGSEGERGILAQDAREFLTLLAIGYDELSGLTLGAEPEQPVDVAQFREWLEETFEVTVPGAWPALSAHADDDFGSWLAAQLGEESGAATPPPPDSPRAQIEGDLVRLLVLLGEEDDREAAEIVSFILDVTTGDTLRSSAKALVKAGVEIESTRAGVETIWISMRDYPRPAQLVLGLVEDPTRADVLSYLGEPEQAGENWLRYVIGGRYAHFEFDGRLAGITLMVDAPESIRPRRSESRPGAPSKTSPRTSPPTPTTTMTMVAWT